MRTFQETVQTLVAGMDKHAARIEAAKLKALGQRNRVESEKEVRKIRRSELESLIKDNKDLLELLELQVPGPYAVSCRAKKYACRSMALPPLAHAFLLQRRWQRT